MSKVMSILRPETVSEGKEKGSFRILQDVRRASILRVLAKNLDGAHITKRLEPKILSMIPDAQRVYMVKETFTDFVELNVVYPDHNCYDDFIHIRLCRASERRLDGKALLEKAEQIEHDVRTRQQHLLMLDTAVTVYNDLADRYAQIYAVLSDFLYNDVPSADFELSHRYYTEPVNLPALLPSSAAPDPIPLPVSEPDRFTMDEFMAMVAQR